MKVSVILTSYNHEKYIGESIESVLTQTYKDFELIIIDDCSNDASWEIISKYKDSRIRKIRNDVNKVWIIKDVIDNLEINGEYIAVHHSDDLWLPDKLAKQVEFLNEHDEIAGVFTLAEVIDENGDTYDNTDGFYYNVFSAENRTRFEWLRYFFYEGNCLCHPSVMMRKEVYYTVRPFINGMYQIGDMMMWIMICQKYNIFVLQEKLVKFRILNKGKNTSGMRADSQIRSSVELFLMLQSYQNIRNKEEFLEIFPEAAEYCTGEKFLPEYALAQLCINVKGQSYYKLFGILLLFQLINDEKFAYILRTQYNYDGKSFVRQVGEKDIFHVLPDMYQQIATIYISTDLEHELIMFRQFRYDYILKEYDFCFQFEISNPIKVMRFDPCEGIPVKCKIEVAQINNEKLRLIGSNCSQIEDGFEFFISKDPIYTICFQEPICGHVILKGRLIRVTQYEENKEIEKNIFLSREKSEENVLLNQRSNELTESIQSLTQIGQGLTEANRNLTEVNCKLMEQNQNLQTDKKQIESMNITLKDEKAQMAKEIERLNLELSLLKSSKLYKVLEKCRTIIHGEKR